jgi:hypothetical protein
MEYIYDKIILVIKFEKIAFIFQTKVVSEFLGKFFYGVDIHKLNLKMFGYLKFLDKFLFKKCFFFIFEQ